VEAARVEAARRQVVANFPIFVGRPFTELSPHCGGIGL